MAGNPEILVNDALCRARVKAHEQRIEKSEERLERHEETLVGVAECLAKLTSLHEVVAAETKEMKSQIRTLESEPADRWKKVLTGIISGGGGAALGALLMKLLGG